MISYHPRGLSAPIDKHESRGFKVLDTNAVEVIAKCISEHAWSAPVFKGGHRHTDKFISAEWFGLDFESPEMTLEQAVKSFSDMIHVVGTTRNHRKLKDGVVLDRFRVLIKADRVITERHVFEGNMRRLSRIFPIDPKTCDGARLFYRCTEIISVQAEGYAEEVLPVEKPDETFGDVYRKELTRMQASFIARGRIPERVQRFLKEGAAVDRHGSAYVAVITLVELGIDPFEVVRMVKAAPITRPFRVGEVEDMVSHAVGRMKKRLATSSGGENAEEAKKEEIKARGDMRRKMAGMRFERAGGVDAAVKITGK